MLIPTLYTNQGMLNITRIKRAPTFLRLVIADCVTVRTSVTGTGQWSEHRLSTHSGCRRGVDSCRVVPKAGPLFHAWQTPVFLRLHTLLLHTQHGLLQQSDRLWVTGTAEPALRGQRLTSNSFLFNSTLYLKEIKSIAY